MSNSHLPHIIHLGAHTYRVDSSPEAAAGVRTEGRRGDSVVELQLIRIDPDHRPSAVAATLLHECLHIAWNHGDLDPDGEEHNVSVLAELLLELLLRNPLLINYIDNITFPAD